MTRENLAEIYDRHAQALFGYLLNLTRDRDETRELLQDTFVKLANRNLDPARIEDERGVAGETAEAHAQQIL